MRDVHTIFPRITGSAEPIGVQLLRPADANLRVAQDYEAAGPRFDILRREDAAHFRQERAAPGAFQSNEDETGVLSGPKHPSVAKGDVLRDEETLFALCRVPNFGISVSGELFAIYVLDVMTHRAELV